MCTLFLFTYELNGDDTQYRCLLKPAVYDPVMSLGFCNYEHTEFQGLIEHLCQDHNYDLTKYINYCCDILFESTLDAIQHYLSHILNLEDTENRSMMTIREAKVFSYKKNKSENEEQRKCQSHKRCKEQLDSLDVCLSKDFFLGCTKVKSIQEC